MRAIACALALASVMAWIAAAGWIALVLRRISLEEPHLRQAFGADDDRCSRHTWRLVPPIY